MSYRIYSLVFVAVLGSMGVARADVVTDWNVIAVDSANSLSSASNAAPRVLAIAHIAAHNALASIDKTHATYPADLALEVKEPISREAAALKAFHAVLTTLVFGKKAELNDKFSAALAKIPGGLAKTHGLALGDAAASAILTLRSADGSSPPDPAYTGSTEVGKWRPTGLDTLGAPVPGVDPHWRKLVPFALATPELFRADAPPAVNSAGYLKDLAEVRSLGGKLATEATPATRSPNQTEIAKFWEFSTHIPVNAVARQVSKREQLSLSENARLFALLNIALSDARVAVWESKYFHSAWRPLTAIVTGDGAEDDGSTSDAAWVPYLNTPAHPEYPSGHSGTGAAGFAVLKAWFGDEVPFTVASDSLPEVTRSFTTFTQAALENGRSRIYGGIHFQYANAAGQTLGRKVGEQVVASQLLELPAEVDAGVADAGEPALDAGNDDDAGLADAGPAEPVDAALPVVDAGAAHDAAVVDASEPEPEPIADAGHGADAAAGDAPEDDEESDSCSLHVGSANAAGALPLLFSLALLRIRRRRR